MRQRERPEPDALTVPKGSHSAHTLTLGFWPPGLRDREFRLFQPPTLWSFVAAAPAHLYTIPRLSAHRSQARKKGAKVRKHLERAICHSPGQWSPRVPDLPRGGARRGAGVAAFRQLGTSRLPLTGGYFRGPCNMGTETGVWEPLTLHPSTNQTPSSSL